MNYILFFLFFSLSLGQLQRINLLEGQVHLYFHDVFLLCFVFLALVQQIQRKKITRLLKKYSRACIPLFFAGVISLFIGFWQYTPLANMVGLLYLGRLVVFLLFFILLQTQKKEPLQQLFILTTVATLTIAYIQYFFFPNFWPLIYLGWDPHTYRAVGSFFDPTTAGSIFMLLGSTTFFFYKKNKDKRYLLAALLFVPLLLLTYSRITYIMMLVTSGYFLIANKNIRLLLFATVLFIATLFLLPRPSGAGVQLERVFSVNSRIAANSVGITLLKNHPFFGVGFNRIRYAQESVGRIVDGNSASGFPSSFVTVAASMGIVGLLSFLYFFLSLWNESLHQRRVLLVALITGALFENIFFVSFVFLIFSLCFAVVTARSES